VVEIAVVWPHGHNSPVLRSFLDIVDKVRYESPAEALTVSGP
jgi:hypothetical protein